MTERWRISTTALLWLILSTGAPAMDDEPLRLGLQGAAAERTLDTIWRPLLSDLGTALDRPVETAITSDYASIVDALAASRIDLAWVGNRNAIEAVDHGGAGIFAQVLSTQGIPGYYSLLITQADRDWNDFDSVWTSRGHLTFGFGDRHSTSGTTVPTYFLFAEQGRDRAEFKAFRFGDHEQNFFDVAEGRVDVATISSVMLQRLSEREPALARRLKTIWASPLIPSDPLVWRVALDEPTKTRVRAFFLDYGRPVDGKPVERVAAEQAILARMKWSGFKGSSNSQLDYVRILALFGELETVKDDPTLSEAERAELTREIRQRIDQAERGLH
jgi:phosphonate transport system substrate-binding protein